MTYGLEAVRDLTVPAATAMAVGMFTGSWTTGTSAGMANLGAEALKRAGSTREENTRAMRQNPYYFPYSTTQLLG